MFVNFKQFCVYIFVGQADQEVMKATGRSDPSNSPSGLAKTIEKLISDLTGLFKSGMSNFFRDSDDAEGELTDGEDDLEETDDNKDKQNKDIGG